MCGWLSTTHKARVYINSYPHVLGVSLIQNSNSPPLPPLTSCSHVTNGVGSGTPLAIAFDTYTAVGDAPWAMMDVTTELPAATKRSPWENAAKADGGSVTLTLGNAGAPMEKPGVSHGRNTSAHTQLVALARHNAPTQRHTATATSRTSGARDRVQSHVCPAFPGRHGSEVVVARDSLLSPHNVQQLHTQHAQHTLRRTSALRLYLMSSILRVQYCV